MKTALTLLVLLSSLSSFASTCADLTGHYNCTTIGSTDDSGFIARVVHNKENQTYIAGDLMGSTTDEDGNLTYTYADNIVSDDSCSEGTLTIKLDDQTNTYKSLDKDIMRIDSTFGSFTDSWVCAKITL